MDRNTIAHSVRQSHCATFARSGTTDFMNATPQDIIAALKRLGVTHDRIAAAIGRERSVATKLLAGSRSMKANEIPKLLELVHEAELESGDTIHLRPLRKPSEVFDDGSLMEYVPVEVMPTFAGMGGGGTGEDTENRKALLPRELVEDQLGAKPSDLLVVPVRGNSMEPHFFNGDQVLVDKRDCDPVQPGPFAIWDGDGVVLKNVERLPGGKGKLRIFSSNPIYSDYVTEAEEVRIMGRPAWLARRL